MFPPRLRILVTTFAALAVAVGAALAVVGSQESTGRTDLTVRARSFLRSLKGEPDGAGRRPSPDPTEFLRPADRGSARNVLALTRLRDAFGDTNDELLVVQVKLLGDGKAVTYTPVALGVPMGQRRSEAGLREIAWVRDADGRWYLDPAGL